MKNLSILVFFILISSIIPNLIFAQKTRDKTISINYTDLPEMVLNEDFMSYSVVIQGTDGSSYGHKSRQVVASFFNLDGYKRFEEDGHIRIVYFQDLPHPISHKANSKKHSKTDKNEKVTTWYTYNYSFVFSVRGAIELVDQNGDIIWSKDYDKKGTVSSKSYRSSRDRSKYFGIDKNRSLKSFAKSAYGEFQKNALTEIKRKIDFDHSKRTEEIHWIKKSDEQEKTSELIERLEVIFKDLKADHMPDEIISELKEMSLYYQDVADKYYDLGLTKKKYKKICFDMLRNAQTLEYYIGDFEKSLELANRMLELDVKNSIAKKRVKRVEKTLIDAERHNVNSLYVKRDFTNIIPPGKVKELEDKLAEEISDNSVFKGFIVDLAKDTTNGEFYIPKGSSELLFGKNGNVTFKTGSGIKATKQKLTLDSILHISVKDKKYYKIKTASYSSGEAVKKDFLLQSIYSSDKIKLFKFLKEDALSDDEFTEFAYQKTGEEAISLLSTQFLILNKGLAKYFSDCPDLVEMCTSGSFQLKQLDLMKAARIYSELCD